MSCNFHWEFVRATETGQDLLEAAITSNGVVCETVHDPQGTTTGYESNCEELSVSFFRAVTVCRERVCKWLNVWLPRI